MIKKFIYKIVMQVYKKRIKIIFLKIQTPKLLIIHLL